MEAIYNDWDWYIAGPIIGLFVPLLLLVGNKLLGISTSFQHICSIIVPKRKSEFLKYNAEANKWKFFFVIGIVIGAFVAVNFLSANKTHFLPPEYYSFTGTIKLFIGGLFIGFGTRYANGCTTGHAIAGLSILNPDSLKATIAFFAGGVIYTFLEYYLF